VKVKAAVAVVEASLSHHQAAAVVLHMKALANLKA
jgi:hypothetical protein